jgi:kynurenine--oxoglutarate transaminase/cysteine-S-conjugate beta-lyase/glutamine--phenylpyruvate transaminase
MSSKITPTERLQGIDRNVWVEFTAIGSKCKVNLGQGFPNYSPPQFLVEALQEAAAKPMLHQYTRGHGHPRLVNALAKLHSILQERSIDPMNEVVVGTGAYSALFFTFQAFVHPGDEVVLIEPFFDCYAPMTKMAGGKVVGIPLRLQGKFPGSSKDLAIDPKELSDAITPKTKMIIINTPHNPSGKVFQREELEMIADLCRKHDILCVSDEVYEWLVHDGLQHTRIATLPGMWERTVTIGSAGKTFNCTGWKLGWAIGPDHLIKHMKTVSSNSSYTLPTILQEAVGASLEKETALIGKQGSFFKEMQEYFQSKRDEMASVLKEIGLNPIVPESGYFMLVDTTPLGMDFSTGDEEYDYQFVKWLAKEKSIALIPPSAFYTPEHKHLSGKMVRFSFCKTNDILQEGYKILRSLKKEVS